MGRAALTKVSLFSMIALTIIQQTCAASEFFGSNSSLPRSPAPDANGLPAPLNLKEDYSGIMPSDTAGNGTFESFSSRHLIPVTAPLPKSDNSDIHLYLNDRTTKFDSAAISVDAVEDKCFSRTYVKDTTEQRLSRLEQFVFGKTSNNPNTQMRLEKIAKVVSPQSVDTVKSESAEEISSVGSRQTVQSAPTQSLISIINDGIDRYNVHDYQRAEDNFDKCCAMAPDMARVHSYLAITKLQLNQRQAAIEEFRTTYAIDPFGTYGRYAKICLLKLAGDEEIRKRGPVDSDDILQSSLSKINNQSQDMINFHNRESSRSAPIPYNTGSFFASQIQATSARNANELQNALTQESANNLKHLMGLKKKPGDAHLRAWGTSLNTRYYGEDTYLYAPYYIPREYPVELKAQQKSLTSNPIKRK